MNKYVKPLMRVLALVAAVNSLSATTGFNFGKGSGIIVLDGTLDLLKIMVVLLLPIAHRLLVPMQRGQVVMGLIILL
jgi:hypothetical protein